MSTERKELIDALRDAAEEVTDIIRTADTSVRIPNSEWTVGDAAAHLVITQRLAISILHGTKSPYGDGKPDFIAEVNKKYLEEFAERDSAKLAEMFLDAVHTFLKDIKKFPDTHILPTHYGSMTLLLGIAYCLTHTLGHGSAIAHALSKPLPIKPYHMKITLPFLKRMMPRVYDRKAADGLNARFVIDMRGIEKFAIFCNPTRATIENTIPTSVDCYLSIDPMTFFLVSNSYLPQWKAILTGKIFLWGKRPWLVFRLKQLFPSP